ncbi:MAG TPA: hypothetical protein PLM60_07360 [Methanoregulaceae archaeon]|nr:hypothetical protein [Burkholderiaceae bacterium]NLH26629.1 hypothetical protein [Methanomicrobiales archaeon]HNJ80883.1 hypothetical protein [Methanoregulaceae archaeon]HOU80046.1 hypothetical protein [Methanoregulaceae archaeon]HPA08702.1 hypothetical protein [Methanoregulaceae archaeon]
MTGTRTGIICILVIVAMVCLSGCISPPDKNTGSAAQGGTAASKGGISGAKATPTAAGTDGVSTTTITPTPAPGEAGYLVPATPYPTETLPASTMSGTRLPDITPSPVEYMGIYYTTLALKNNRTAFTYDLQKPPLVIEICFSPNMTTRTIWYDSKYTDRGEKTETVTTISPAAWFEVTVREPASGQIVAKEGFARGYSTDTGKDLTIRSQGKYLIEFSGNELSAQVQIRVPKEGNPAGSPLKKMACTF